MTQLDVINPLNDDLIDQIVDGALTPAQLRAAIDCLDREPDGWKRCALAFLEAQCWRESFRLVGEPKATSLKAESRSRNKTTSSRSEQAGGGSPGLWQLLSWPPRSRWAGWVMMGTSGSRPGCRCRGAVGRACNEARRHSRTRDPHVDGR